MHKAILLQRLKNLVTCLKCDDIFWYKLHIFSEHWASRVHFLFNNACGIVFMIYAKAQDIKGKLGPPWNKSNFNLSPPILALFLLNAPHPRLFFEPPPDNYCTVPKLNARKSFDIISFRN